MNYSSSRLQREAKTIKIMVEKYCAAKHDQQNELCQECTELLEYANKRLAKCPFQEKKPTCGKCHIHCYKKDYRKRIQEVMRFMGPRMITTNPVLAAYHFIDGFKGRNTP